MRNFDESISFNGQVLNVSFTLVFTIHGRRYFVTVIRDKVNYFFEMQQDKAGNWSVIQPSQEWLKEIESKLSESITKNTPG